jgi:hypothetical protein
MKKYTKKQRQEYYAKLRADWKKSKAMAENDEVAKGLFREVQKQGGKFSYWSFYFTLSEMKAQGLDGLPYVDCKTFDGWKNAGFIVKKGEKTVARGITWIKPTKKNKNGEEVKSDYVYPKLYNLYHRSQVEERANWEELKEIK